MAFVLASGVCPQDFSPGSRNCLGGGWVSRQKVGIRVYPEIWQAPWPASHARNRPSKSESQRLGPDHEIAVARLADKKELDKMRRLGQVSRNVEVW
jgi:hypothetical protein